MKILGVIVLIGSLILLALGFYGRVHIVLSAELILKVMGAVGIVAALALMFGGGNNGSAPYRNY